MDIFSEQLERKERGASYVIKKTAILIGSFLLALVFVCGILVFVPILAPLGFLAGFGLMYLGIWLSNSLDIEYEYIVTGTCLDIDKIISMKSRKKLLSVDIPTFEDFGKYTQDKSLPDVDVTIEAVFSPRAPLYYAIFTHDKYGKTMLLFNPNDRTLDTIDTSLPRQLRVF